MDTATCRNCFSNNLDDPINEGCACRESNRDRCGEPSPEPDGFSEQVVVVCMHCNNDKENMLEDMVESCSECKGICHRGCMKDCPKQESETKKRFLKAAGVAVVVGVGAVAAAPLVLTAAGFTSAGVAGGSIAASIQSAVYGGATTGAFSALQSAGAAGISAGAQAVIASAAGATGGMAGWKIFSQT